MLKRLTTLLPKRKGSYALLGVAFLFGVALLVHETRATNFIVELAEGSIARSLAIIIIAINKLLAGILVVVTNILVAAASYNDFVNAPAVEKGWVIVRDLSNMFFIVVLLVIAFGTILRIQAYRFQQTLPRFIIWAVLINFSKLIAGVWIDFAQVVTLTFVNAFRDTAAGNIVDAFGLRDMLTLLHAGTPEAAGFGDILGALVLSLILLIIATITVVSIAIVFIFRIVALWLLVVLSPIAYLTRTFPNAVKYSDQWWQMFNKYVLAGPVLAFFLWLALTIVGTEGYQTIIPIEQTEKVVGSGTSAFPANTLAASISAISSSDRLLSFLLTTSLFLGALMATQQLGVMGTGVTAGALHGIQRGALGTARWIAKRPVSAYTWTARKYKAGQVPTWLGGKLLRGIELNPANIIRGIREERAERRIQEELRGTQEAGANLRKGGLRGFLTGAGSPRDWANTYMQGMFYSRGIKRAFMGRAELAQDKRKMAEEEEKRAEELEEDASLGDPAGMLQEKLAKEKAEKQEDLEAVEQKLGRGAVIDSEIRGLKGKVEKENEKEESERDFDKIRKWEERISELEKDKSTWEKEMKKERPTLEEKKTKLEEEVRDVEGRISHFESLTPEQQHQEGMREFAKEKAEIEAELKRVSEGGASEEMKLKRNQQLALVEQEIRRIDVDIRRFAARKTDANDEERKKIDEHMKRLEELREQKENWKERLEDDSKRLTREDYEKFGIRLNPNEKTEEEMFKEDELDEHGKKTGRTLGEGILQGLKEAFARKSRQEALIGNLTEVERKELLERARLHRAAAAKFKKESKDVLKWIPQDYYARAAGRAAMAMEQKNVDTSNEFELVALFKNAVADKNRALATAIARQAASVGHLNELIMAEGYTANQEGLNELINKVFVGEMGMDKQVAFSVQNDLSNLAERINHWTYAQSVGLADGRFYQRTQHEQGLRSAVEMMKRDPEGIIRQSNRLAYGGEDPEGTFHLSETGLMMIAKGYKNIMSQFPRGRFNRSAAASLVTPEAFAQLQALAQTSIISNKREFREFLDALRHYAAGSAELIRQESAAASRILGHVVPATLPNA